MNPVIFSEHVGRLWWVIHVHVCCRSGEVNRLYPSRHLSIIIRAFYYHGRDELSR